MSDLRCGWCGAGLSGPAAHGRRCCGRAHRQAAVWQARRRWQRAAPEREGVPGGDGVLLPHVNRLAQGCGSSRWPRPLARWHCATAAQNPGLASELIRAAVVADRRSGASCAQAGAGLGITAEAARDRFERTRRAARSGRDGR
ncbi:hypothetical protein ACIGDI_27650 [Streptomyces sp. NPDC085900]|uniref:hypothetical protein n=1 Tax=Streptomyces sp. NPDC085900 TaxID=3365737 RepID=UPI0037D6A1A5